MSTYLQRLQGEITELSEKRTKLGAFQETPEFKKLDPVQQSLLLIQFSAMLTYEQCLGERLVWLAKKTDQ